jgi:MFS family permease
LSLRERGTSSAAIGILMTCGSAGSLLGALLAPRLIRSMSTNGLLLTVGSFWTAGLVIFAAGPPVALTAAVFSALLIISPASGVLMGKLTLTAVPRDLLGRVRGAVDTTVYGLAMLAPIMAGVMIERFGLPTTWLVFAVIAGAGTVVAGPRWYNNRFWRGVRPSPLVMAQPGTAPSNVAVTSAAMVEK